MHQGNLRCGIDGELIVMDFGIMGRIDLYTRRVYAQILNGFINKKYRKVAEVHFEAGYISYDQDIDKFAQATSFSRGTYIWYWKQVKFLLLSY